VTPSGPTVRRGSRRPLLALALLLLLAGGLPALGLLGVARLASTAAGWSALFGWLAWPLCGLSLAVGGWLTVALLRGLSDPWRLPWGRALAVEMALVAALALLSLAADGGGLVGWALASASRQAIGPVGAVLLWMATGIVGSLLTFRYGTDRLTEWFESVAQALDAPLAPRGAIGPAAATAVDRSADRDWSGSTDRANRDPWADFDEAPAPARPPREEMVPGRPNVFIGRPARTAPEREQGATDNPPDRVARGAGEPPPSTAPLRPVHSGPPKLRIARGGASSARRVTRASALPEIALLGEDEAGGLDTEGLRAVATRIEQILDGFGVPVKVIEIEHGPAVTRFGLVPGTYEIAGEIRRVKVSRITALRDDLALALAAPSIRIEAPVPGKAMVGLEIPNPETAAVGLAGLLRDKRFRAAAAKSGLALALGRDVSGAVAAADLGKMPHLLIAGATGSGKSVCLNTVLASLLFQNTPDVLRLILVDPKRVELARFKRLPHLIAPVVTDVSEVVGALRWTSVEMDRRYKAFAERGARDLKAYNRKLPTGEPPLPRIVLIIDELADLMLQAPDETEPLLTRLAQLARATGIHLVVATQRPSTDVITGLIKANFPARIAFAVASSTDSRVILDSPGAEMLLGSGDMLFQPPDAPKPRRLQGAYVSDEELDRLVAFWQDSPWAAPPRLPPWDDLIPPDDPEEALYEEAVAVALAVSRVSASLLQRRLRIGYGKARALLDRMRREEIVDDQGRPDLGPDPEPPPAPARRSPPPKQAQKPLPTSDPTPSSPPPSREKTRPKRQPAKQAPPPRSERPSPPPPEVDRPAPARRPAKSPAEPPPNKSPSAEPPTSGPTTPKPPTPGPPPPEPKAEEALREADSIAEVEIDESDLLMAEPDGMDEQDELGDDDEDLSWVDAEFNA